MGRLENGFPPKSWFLDICLPQTKGPPLGFDQKHQKRKGGPLVLGKKYQKNNFLGNSIFQSFKKVVFFGFFGFPLGFLSFGLVWVGFVGFRGAPALLRTLIWPY